MDSGVLWAWMQQTTQAAGNVSGFVDYSISIGDLATVATTIIAVVSAYARLVSRIDVMDTKLEPLWGEFVERLKARRP